MPDMVQGSPVLAHQETAQFEIRACISNFASLVTSLAVPICIALGALFCTLVYSDQIRAFIAQYPRLKILTTHPLHVGGGLLAIGSLLFLRKMVDCSTDSAKQSEKPVSAPQEVVKEQTEESSHDSEEISRLEDEVRSKEQEAVDLRNQLDELKQAKGSQTEPKQELDVRQQTEELSRKAKEISKLQDKVRTREQEASDLRSQLEELKRASSDLESTLQQQKLLTNATEFAEMELELEERNEEFANLEQKLQESEDQAQIFKKQLEEKTKAFTFESKGKHYHIMSLPIEIGSVKTIKQGCSDHAEEIGLSVLDELEKPELFEMMFVPRDVIQALQKAASKNQGGGLGLILDVINQGIVGSQRQTFVQPWYNLGNLWNNLLKGNELSPKERAVLFQDIFNGYLALHEEGLIHGDPKAQNVFLDDQKGLHAFVGDFDLTHFGKSNAVLDPFPWYLEKKATLGTPSCWAPELFFEDDVKTVDRFKAEVWGVGMIAALFLIRDPEIVQKVIEAINECEEDGPLDHADLKKKFRKKNGCVDFKKTCNRFNKWLDWNKVKMVDSKLDSLKPILELMLQPDPSKRQTLLELKPSVDAALIKILS